MVPPWKPRAPIPTGTLDSSDRHFEWVYAMSFVLYVFAQHYLGDLDNTGLSFDISVKTLPHWQFYGEMLWDDMKKGTSMFDDSWWGNKWSASVGLTPLFKKVEDNSLIKAKSFTVYVGATFWFI